MRKLSKYEKETIINWNAVSYTHLDVYKRQVKSCVDTAARFNERTEEQKLQNRPQTRQKKEDMTR